MTPRRSLERRDTLPGNRYWQLSSVLVGIAVAAWLSPKDAYFLGNFAFYWLPQAAVLATLLLRAARPAVLSGVAIALALYLGLYGAWVFSRPQPESLAWIGYLFSFPGGVIGAFASAALMTRMHLMRAAMAAAAGTLLTSAGLAANQWILCSTVMHCTV